MLMRVELPQIVANARMRRNGTMNCFWSKSLVTLAASGVFATIAQADLAEWEEVTSDK